MDDHLEAMKLRFNDHLYMLKSNKGKNNQLFTREEYNSLIAKVKESKEKTSAKTPEDYQRISRYDIVRIGGDEKLIVKVQNEGDPIVYYTCMEENFQIIHEIHIAIGHGGRNRMMREVKTTYKNITIEMVMIYLNLCEPCQMKQSVPRKGQSVPRKSLIVKPIVSSVLNSRCQVDLIDMQSQADGDFKFIMVYQDHLTKFIQLRALKTNQAEEVACHLLDVFTIFGAPCILQSDNGQEFTSKIIEKVCGMWNELKIVHGKPRLSESQGSVERTNQDIENMLSTWLETNNTKKWSEGIKFIQLMKNRAHHSGIGRSPHEAMFSCKAKVGLGTYLPIDSLSRITSEEDLVLRNESNNDAQLQTAISTEDEDIGAMNDDNKEVGNSSEDLEVITVTSPIKNRTESVSQNEWEQHNTKIKKTDDGKREIKSFIDIEMELRRKQGGLFFCTR
ncbi:KRAB-A domain-containing protein 2 [Araneus ventricosus]|uniref:KRAB-A domain-containing protein 2 n=1 Tax=Araneus ventricosus TaxID=182803 RepID=A0A4Y2BIJ0_ARAVE|nr:KRAB-A domain-containing protein 2 [Araneus ventricosus]